MLRLFFLVLLFAPVVLLAAPVPPEDSAARLKRIYGAVDPDDDCTYEMIGDKLRIGVPGPHFLGRNAGSLPRVVREVEGDFSVEVRVYFAVPVGTKADRLPPNLATFADAGILVWADAKNYVSVERQWREDEPKGTIRPIVSYINPGVNGTAIGDNAPGEEPTHLRLVRKGDQFDWYTKPDGRKWSQRSGFELSLPRRVKVGVCASHSTVGQFQVTFDEYSLTQPKK